MMIEEENGDTKGERTLKEGEFFPWLCLQINLEADTPHHSRALLFILEA